MVKRNKIKNKIKSKKISNKLGDMLARFLINLPEMAELERKIEAELCSSKGV
jgi:hypothetical protein